MSAALHAAASTCVPAALLACCSQMCDTSSAALKVSEHSCHKRMCVHEDPAAVSGVRAGGVWAIACVGVTRADKTRAEGCVTAPVSLMWAQPVRGLHLCLLLSLQDCYVCMVCVSLLGGCYPCCCFVCFAWALLCAAHICCRAFALAACVCMCYAMGGLGASRVQVASAAQHHGSVISLQAQRGFPLCVTRKARFVLCRLRCCSQLRAFGAGQGRG
jgi:hypothetical protein